MPIRTNAMGGAFKINSEIEYYIISDDTGVKRGDLLHIIGDNATTFIGDNTVDAIAMQNGSKGDSIRCYVLKYRTRYKDLNNQFPYIVLSQFTYRELETLVISSRVSPKGESISTATGDLISRYTCDNLNEYGTRNKNKS